MKKVIDNNKFNKMFSIPKLINTKNTNLILSADLTDGKKILELVDKLGPTLLGVKLHSDIINADEYFYENLLVLKDKYHLIIIDDRKFCDIGNTVKLQSEKICKYADLITVHAISGPGILDGLRRNCEKYDCRVLLIAEMSSENNLIDQNYTKKVVKMARDYDDLVAGFICQSQLDTEGDFIHFTPGVQLPAADGVREAQDGMGQRYKTPQYLIEKQKVDVLIVGRGIYQFADDPLVEAKKYIYTKRMAAKKTAMDTIKLGSLGIVKKGDFTLKSGVKSDTYIDLRLLMTFPRIMNIICEALFEILDTKFKTQFYNYNIIGVPMGALPIATVFSQVSNISMIMLRDKQKEYGCKNLIEGETKSLGCIVIEDVITTGGSVIEFIKRLEAENVRVAKVLCVLDREQGGVKKLSELGYNVECLFTLSELSK